jgi:adenine deaminase
MMNFPGVLAADENVHAEIAEREAAALQGYSWACPDSSRC